MNELEPVALPIDGVLDLHTFHPREIKELIPEYLAACHEKGILEVRIIHGKGTGAIRETVHAVLRRMPEVVSFRLAGQESGGWGASLVVLRPVMTKEINHKMEKCGKSGRPI
jgi:DNA-nicking Smr family endonuclease